MPRPERAGSARRTKLGALLALPALIAATPPPADAAELDPSPVLAAPATPRTGFESSGGARWTTPAEEARFLNTIDTARPEAFVRPIGASEQGRPLRLARLGSASPGAQTVLFTCSQHGDEPSGREGCLSTFRDLAYSEGPGVRRFLATHSVLFVPNVNPDGHVAGTRENARDVDINRDHLELASPEARAMAGVVRDERPDVIHDLHEYGPEPPYYVKDVLALWPRNRNVADGVHRESVRLTQEHVRPAQERAGRTTGVYGIWTDPNTGEPIKQVAGDGRERILRNTAGVKNALGLLVEARSDPLTEREKADPALNNRRRVDSQITGARATLRMLGERGESIAAVTDRARLDATANRGPVYFGGADNEEPAPGEVEPDPTCGYRLTGAQVARAGDRLTLHGLRSVPEPGGGRFVPMNQPERSAVALLLDGRARSHLVSGRPVPCG